MDYLVVKNVFLTALVYIIGASFAHSYDPTEWNLLVCLIAGGAAWNIWTGEE